MTGHTNAADNPVCKLCGEPMPPGEEMFKFHGYSGPCPKPPKVTVAPEHPKIKTPPPATKPGGLRAAPVRCQPHEEATREPGEPKAPSPDRAKRSARADWTEARRRGEEGGVREPTRFRDSGIRYRGHPAGVIKSSARDSGIR
jgi:hypothetical protein